MQLWFSLVDSPSHRSPAPGCIPLRAGHKLDDTFCRPSRVLWTWVESLNSPSSCRALADEVVGFSNASLICFLLVAVMLLGLPLQAATIPVNSLHMASWLFLDNAAYRFI